MRELSHSTSGEEGLEKLVPVIFASKTNENFESLILSSLSRVNGGLKYEITFFYLFQRIIIIKKNNLKPKQPGMHKLRFLLNSIC